MEEFEIEENGKTPTPNYFESIEIKLNEIQYILSLKEIDENNLTLSINANHNFPSKIYKSSINLKEIKGLNRELSKLNSLNDFYYYIKSLSEKKKLNIKEDKDKISLILIIENSLNKQEIKIDLFPIKKSTDSDIKEIYQELLNIKTEIDALKKENKKIMKDNEEIKKDNNILKNENKKLNNKINLLEKDNHKLNIEINNLKNEIKNKHEIKENKEAEKNQIKIIQKDNIKQKEKKDINKNLNEENNINDELVNQIYNELKEIFEISGLYDEGFAKRKIKELKCDRNKIKEWISNRLLD